MARFHILRTALPNAGREVGDISSVVEDDHGWGKYASKEAWLAEHPNLYVVEVPGLPVARAQRMYQRWIRPALPTEPEAREDRPQVKLGPHRWNFKIDNPPPGQANARILADLQTQGWASMPRGLFNQWLLDRAGLDVADTGNPIDPVIGPPPSRG